MNLLGLCSVCGRPGAMFTCILCGRNVCNNCFDKSHNICGYCKIGKQ
jgi:hypothetical protein